MSGSANAHTCTHACACPTRKCANTLRTQDASGGLPQPADLSAARSLQRSGNAIPVIAAADSSSSSSASLAQLVPALSGPADGFCLPLPLLVPAGAAVGAAGSSADDSSEVSIAVGGLLQTLTEGHNPGVCACV
jgi:hypothetical protein